MLIAVLAIAAAVMCCEGCAREELLVDAAEPDSRETFATEESAGPDTQATVEPFQVSTTENRFRFAFETPGVIEVQADSTVPLTLWDYLPAQDWVTLYMDAFGNQSVIRTGPLDANMYIYDVPKSGTPAEDTDSVCILRNNQIDELNIWSSAPTMSMILPPGMISPRPGGQNTAAPYLFSVTR